MYAINIKLILYYLPNRFKLNFHFQTLHLSFLYYSQFFLWNNNIFCKLYIYEELRNNNQNNQI